MTKTALITGASSGIGAAMAKIHAAAGGDLVLVARREKQLNALKNELESTYTINAHVIVQDLIQPEATQTVYDKVKALDIQVDYLINNAGFGGQGKFYERKWEKDLNMIQLNIVTLTALTRLFLPDFIARDSGKILQVSSTASLLPGPLQAVYFATKAYVTSFSNALSEEIRDTKVTVSALLPGATATEFAQTSGMDQTDLFKNTFSAQEVAQHGYDGMLEGKLNILAGLTFSQKLLVKSIPFTPTKILLKQIYDMQEAKE
jgi:short-subunit dehydrogenase